MSVNALAKETAASEIDKLCQAETKAKAALDERAAALAAKQERRNSPRPDDTQADLVKLSTEIIADEAAVAIAKRDYARAQAARMAAEDRLLKQKRQQWRSELLATSARHMQQADERYATPLRAVLAFLEERAVCAREIREFNEMCQEGEDMIVDAFEQMRFSPAMPDDIVEVEVERRVRPKNLVSWDPANDFKNWPVQKVKEQQVANPGRSRIVPTPLHEIFGAPALRPGERNFKVDGVRRPDILIDVNGAEYKG